VTGSHDRPDQLAAKVVAALDRIARGQRSRRQATASRLGLTPLQAELLRTISEGPPPVPTVGRLAVELGVSQPTVTDSLRALERKDLLVRREDRSDARRTVLSLTDQGRRQVQELTAGEAELVTAVAAMDSERQESTLGSLLALMAAMVDTGTLQVARTCLTCRFHQLQRADGAHHCTLLGQDLRPGDLRVNCPEHASAAPVAGP